MDSFLNSYSEVSLLVFYIYIYIYLYYNHGDMYKDNSIFSLLLSFLLSTMKSCIPFKSLSP